MPEGVVRVNGEYWAAVYPCPFGEEYKWQKISQNEKGEWVPEQGWSTGFCCEPVEKIS